MNYNFRSQLEFTTRFPSPQSIPTPALLIVDKKLGHNPAVKQWLDTFDLVYFLEAGENLKQLKSFEKHLHHILNLVQNIPSKHLTFVAIGGGSVGDFTGFLASIFKRGAPLFHIPSTWLAAVDSAHGGKTALNIGDFKNQIGTFYPAQKVILCRPLLLTQPPERTQEAMGEIIKTALLAGGSLWNKISKEKTFNSQKLWKYLPSLIAYKYQIVLKDPFEKKGLRFVLNLGHTFGHAFELKFRLPHGNAVNLGLYIALKLSESKQLMSSKQLQQLLQTPLLKNHLASPKELKPLLKDLKYLISLLSQDKKQSSKGNVNFIYISKPGRPKAIETSLKELSERADHLRNIL